MRIIWGLVCAGVILLTTLGLFAVFALPWIGNSTRRTSTHDNFTETLPPHAIRRLGTTHFVSHSNTSGRLEYSPDGRYLASVSFESMGSIRPYVQIWDRRTGQEVTPSQLVGVACTGMAWGPGQNQFVTCHEEGNPLGNLLQWKIGWSFSKTIGDKDESAHAVACSRWKNQIALQTANQTILYENGTPLWARNTPRQKKTWVSSRSLDFSPDGKGLATLSDAGVVYLDTKDGKVLREWPILEKTINAIRVLPGGRSIGVAGAQDFHLLPLDSQEANLVFPELSSICDFAVTADESLLVKAGFDRTGVFHLKNREKLKDFPRWGTLGVAISPNGKEIALSTRKISFISTKNWELASQEEFCPLLTTGLLSEGKLWTCGDLVREWDLEKGTLMSTIKREHGSTVSIALIGDQHIACAGSEPEIEVYNRHTREKLFELPGHECATSFVAWSEPLQRLVSAGCDGAIKLWDIDQRSLDREYQIDNRKLPIQHFLCSISPDGNYLACSKSNSQTAVVIRLSDGHQVWKTENAFESALLATTFSNDSHLFSFSEPSHPKDTFPTVSLRLYDLPNRNISLALHTKAHGVNSVAISPDNNLVALGLRRDDFHLIELWSMETQTKIATFDGHRDYVRSLIFTPTGDRLISVSQDCTILIWDVKPFIR